MTTKQERNPDRWFWYGEPVGANPSVKPESVTGRRRVTAKKEHKDHDNVGGLVIYVAKRGGAIREEVARIGFVRETSENPGVTFKQKRDDIIEVARITCETLNKNTPDGELL